MKLQLVQVEFAPEILCQLEAVEAELVREVSARPDTVGLIITDAARLVGYAVMGFDANGWATVYAARSVNHMIAKIAMQSIFGAAQVLGVPLRVHTDKLKAMARMMGAGDALACLDGDGLPMGVFHGV